MTPKKPSAPASGSRSEAPVSRPSGTPAPVDAPGKTRDLLQVAPKIEAPKGGGALKGIGETFKANPATGSASLSLPLPLSPGRNGRTPALGLSYDSGAGNGIFGLGWSLSLPLIQRSTDKTLPRYRDTDTFVMSEVESLVPVGNPTSSGSYSVQRYQPRTEGGFARIERWTHTDGSVHWRTLDRTNVRRSYGASSSARLADPAAPLRVFAWYLEEEWDELGNGVRYVYDLVSGTSPGTGVADSNQRTVAFVAPRRVQYGNKTPDTFNDGWYFEVVFDYGDHTSAVPGLNPDTAVPLRPDPFSRFQAGFDVRCHRLCRRVLLFHRFDEATPANDGQDSAASLIRSLDLSYDLNPIASTLQTATVRGWAADGTSLTMPALLLEYIQPSQAAAPEFLQGIEDLPHGVDFSRSQWVDLDGEGLSGLLTEAGNGWWYKRNEGEGRLGAWNHLPSRPAVPLSAVQLGDIDGDGRLEVMVRAPGVAGSWSRSEEGAWEPFRSFRQVPYVNQDGLNSRMMDVDGDGRADLLVATATGILVFRSDGRDGYLAPERIARAATEADGPVLLFANGFESLFLADMNGDGMVDLVRIRHASVCWWPNLGYGRFGRRIQMANAPFLDRSDRFDARRVRLADIDGTGPADLMYLGSTAVRWWPNQAGNGFDSERQVPGVPSFVDPVQLTVADIRGDGTACLVWSSPLMRDAWAPIRYLRLMSQGKPWLLKSTNNQMGRITTMQYTPSTAFYLADRRAGQPWATRLPFPVHCLSRVTVADSVTGWSNTTRYAYHHGYFDSAEREFRGFGKVEQWDTEALILDAAPTDLPPIRTVSWFHTGAWLQAQRLEDTFAAEYFQGDSAAFARTPSTFDSGLSPVEQREAHRALRGQLLRQEVYAEDGSSLAAVPYIVTESAAHVRKLQPATDTRHGVFQVLPSHSLTCVYDRNAADPRIAQQLTLATDAYGTVTRSAAIVYPRRGTGHPAEQSVGHVLITEADVLHDDSATQLHLAVPLQSKSWHLSLSPTTLQTAASVNAAFDAATAIDFDDAPTGTWKRLLSHQRITYADDSGAELAFGSIGTRLLPHQTFARVYTPAQAAALLALPSAPALSSAGYLQLSGLTGWWAASGTQTRDTARFFAPTALTDPFGNTSSLSWHPSSLFPASVTDPLSNVVSAAYDLRTLTPHTLTDPNGSRTLSAFDALGRVTATAVAGPVSSGFGDSLASPTATFSYDLSTLPVSATGRARETHGVAVGSTRWIETRTWSDGAGNAVMVKSTANPAAGSSTPRWLGSGRVVLNNKGLPLRQYEPFYAATFSFEPEEGFAGVSPLLTYDAVGRAVRIDLPDGNHRHITFDPWQQTTFDENDTTSGHAHENTPTTVHLDVLGRPFQTDEQLTATGTPLTTHVTMDINGSPLVVRDARSNAIQTQTFDMLGRPIRTISPDAGDSDVLLDVAGQPLIAWRSGGLILLSAFDALRRRTTLTVTEGGTSTIREVSEYGESAPSATAHFLRGRLWRLWDTAGRVETPTYDFKGNVLTSTRRFWDRVGTGTDTVTWDATPDVADLESEAFTTSQTFDAMNRPTTQTAPDGTVTVLTYGDGGQLDEVAVGGTDYVTSVSYNARGQREEIAYGNGVTTTHTYDSLTFRLTRLHSVRSSDGATLQDLVYSYDPVGNITEIVNDADDTVYFANTAVSPDQQFTYDALYRLISATGREKTALGFVPPGNEPPFGTLPDLNTAVQRYTQSYAYDAVGNILEMAHVVSSGSPHNWTRTSTYAADCNRIVDSTVGTNTETFVHNVRGSIVYLPHLRFSSTLAPNITTDFRDQMVVADLPTAGHVAHYWYDAAGQRVRKLVVKGTVVEERKYVGGFEVWRKFVTGTLTEERTTLHVADGQQRIALIENKTVGTNAPLSRVRFQLGNHLGTAVLEVDLAAALISYEEYHPYGTTAWQANNGDVEVSAKRYRYTGMERDEETGLQCHGVRYYIGWLGRWSTVDPIELSDGVNRYAYVHEDPVRKRDILGLEAHVGLWSSNETLANAVASSFNEQLQKAEFDSRASVVAENGVWYVRFTEGATLPGWANAMQSLKTSGISMELRAVDAENDPVVPNAAFPERRETIREATDKDTIMSRIALVGDDEYTTTPPLENSLAVTIPSEGLLRYTAKIFSEIGMTEYKKKSNPSLGQSESEVAISQMKKLAEWVETYGKRKFPGDDLSVVIFIDQRLIEGPQMLEGRKRSIGEVVAHEVTDHVLSRVYPTNYRNMRLYGTQPETASGLMNANVYAHPIVEDILLGVYASLRNVNIHGDLLYSYFGWIQ